MCCALRRAVLGAILSLILFRTYRARGQGVRDPAFTRLDGTKERTTIVKERDGLKRRGGSPSVYLPVSLRKAGFKSLRAGLQAASFHLRSLSHKLESLQASYPHMSVRR